MNTLHDIYRCPGCVAIAAHGNSFCRGCGNKFSADDIELMKATIKTPLKVLPWNLRDIYRCVHCDEHIALEDAYCRGCGDQICDQEKQLMKLRLDEIARDNTPALIGLALFVILVILLSAAMARY